MDHDPEFRVEDRRHSARTDEAQAADDLAEPAAPAGIDELRSRAEGAERKLLEYSEAFKKFRGEQDEVRQRLSRDVDRRVELRFAALVGELLEALDNLDLALAHAADAPPTPLVAGVRLARDRFVAALERVGVQRVAPDGCRFDPHEAEAVRVDPVESPEREDLVTETLQPGYRIGESLIRPARVAVGRRAPVPTADQRPET